MDSTQLRVLQEPNEVRLGRLLQREEGIRLEAWCVSVFLCDYARKSLCRELANQQLPRAMERAKVSQGDGTKVVAALARDFATGLGTACPSRGSPRQTSRRLAASTPPCHLPRPRH